jgi:hypothetical protein
VLLPLLAVWLAGCTLIHQDLPNEGPEIQQSEADTLTVRRGGRVSLKVVAVDEDDDPLFYAWRAWRVSDAVATAVAELGTSLFTATQELRSLDGLLQLGVPAGGFADSTSATAVWVAPEATTGAQTRYLLTVTVRDRWCEGIVDPGERVRCAEESARRVQVFQVTVAQRPPVAEVPRDTLLSFRQPSLTLVATATDPDGDPLTFAWSQIAGPVPLLVTTERTGTGPSRMSTVPMAPGEYAFRVVVSDGADSVAGEARVQVYADPEPPAGGMARLVLPDGGEYEIDTYEYPGQRGAVPRLAESWFEAAGLCAAEGKRLCSGAEWTHACSGGGTRLLSSTDALERLSPQYGWRFCNGKGSSAAGNQPDPVTGLAPSGSFANCSGPEGMVYDLSGNAAEWLGERDIEGRWIGGLSLSELTSWPPAPCSSVIALQPLPAGFEPGDRSGESNLGDEYAIYRQTGRGFRCCR